DRSGVDVGGVPPAAIGRLDAITQARRIDRPRLGEVAERHPHRLDRLWNRKEVRCVGVCDHDWHGMIRMREGFSCGSNISPRRLSIALSVAVAQAPEARDLLRRTDTGRDYIVAGLATGRNALRPNGEGMRQPLNQNALDLRGAGTIGVGIAGHTAIAISARRRRRDAVNGRPLLDQLLAIARDYTRVRVPVPDRDWRNTSLAARRFTHATSPFSRRQIDTGIHALQ